MQHPAECNVAPAKGRDACSVSFSRIHKTFYCRVSCAAVAGRFFKAVCLWNGQPVLFEIKIAGKKDTTHSEILFLCIYQVRMCSWYAPSLFPKNTPNHGSQPPSSRSEQMCCCDP